MCEHKRLNWYRRALWLVRCPPCWNKHVAIRSTRRTCRFVSRRDVTSQVEFGLKCLYFLFVRRADVTSATTIFRAKSHALISWIVSTNAVVLVVVAFPAACTPHAVPTAVEHSSVVTSARSHVPTNARRAVAHVTTGALTYFYRPRLQQGRIKEFVKGGRSPPVPFPSLPLPFPNPVHSTSPIEVRPLKPAAWSGELPQ